MAVKVARYVLRGGSESNPTPLLDRNSNFAGYNSCAVGYVVSSYFRYFLFLKNINNFFEKPN